MVKANPIRNLDPAVTLSQDIAQFVVDWTQISKIHKVDKILIHISGVDIESKDLKQLLEALLIHTPGEGSHLEVNSTYARYKHGHSHVSSDKDFHGPSSENIVQVIPKIHLTIKAGKRKAEIHI